MSGLLITFGLEGPFCPSQRLEPSAGTREKSSMERLFFCLLENLDLFFQWLIDQTRFYVISQSFTYLGKYFGIESKILTLNVSC